MPHHSYAGTVRPQEGAHEYFYDRNGTGITHEYRGDQSPHRDHVRRRSPTDARPGAAAGPDPRPSGVEVTNAGTAPLPAAVTGHMAHPAAGCAILGRAGAERQVLALDTAAGSAVTGVP